MQISKAPQSAQKVMACHCDTKRQDIALEGQHCTETFHHSEELQDYNPSSSIKMTKRYDSTWDWYLGRITVAKNRITLNPTGVPPIHAVPYRAGLK